MKAKGRMKRDAKFLMCSIYVCRQEGGHSEKCMRCKQRATFKKDIQGER